MTSVCFDLLIVKNEGPRRIGGSVIVEPAFWPIHRAARFLYDGVMNPRLRSLIDEPAVADPPPTGWFDVLLVGCVLVGLVFEAIFRTDLVFKPGALIVIALVSVGLLFRRQEPLLGQLFAFGAVLVLDFVAFLAGREAVEVYSAVCLLIFAYSLYRWGSGAQALVGTAVMMAVYVQTQLLNFTTVGDLIGGGLVLCFPPAIALIVRYRRSFRDENIARIKLHEREQLARDLHDTVAHHVSAIAIQAQAGQMLAASAKPEGAAQALAVIEEEASRTLVEMRAIVQMLRNGNDDVEHAPQRGVNDLASLAESAAMPGMRVDVSVTGDTQSLSPLLDAGIYRLAQESITNARRHAQGATAVTVDISIAGDEVTLAVCDDGMPVAGSTSTRGWGIVGMTERAELLGGTLHAGPTSPRGWQVSAVLPHRTRSKAPINVKR